MRSTTGQQLQNRIKMKQQEYSARGSEPLKIIEVSSVLRHGIQDYAYLINKKFLNTPFKNDLEKAYRYSRDLGSTNPVILSSAIINTINTYSDIIDSSDHVPLDVFGILLASYGLLNTKMIDQNILDYVSFHLYRGIDQGLILADEDRLVEILAAASFTSKKSFY